MCIRDSFFTAEGHKNDRASRPQLLRAKQTRQLKHAGGTRGIVIGAVMYLTFARRQTTFTAVAEVIVMRADYDDFAFECWIGTVENADDVGGRRQAMNNLG